MHPGEEPCGRLHVARLPSGETVAETVRDDVALWHETDAVVIEHVTPVLSTVNLWLDGAAEVTVGAKTAPSTAAIKTIPSRMFPPNFVPDSIILRIVTLAGQRGRSFDALPRSVAIAPDLRPRLFLDRGPELSRTFSCRS
jgi:hypothetical protein